MKTAKMISKSRPISELNRVNREPSKLRLRSSPMRFRIELIVIESMQKRADYLLGVLNHLRDVNRETSLINMANSAAFRD